jgi:hypothetical protein
VLCFVCSAGHPNALVPWRSCRVLVSGQLQWMAPGAVVGGPPAAVSKAARRGVRLPGPVYVTTAQVSGMSVAAPLVCNCCDCHRLGGGTVQGCCRVELLRADSYILRRCVDTEV